MNALGTKMRQGQDGYTVLWCPACDKPHALGVRPGAWTWDGNVEAPTFAPSLRVTSSDPACCCHSYVRAGKWEYLPDCSHALAGQTVPVPTWPEPFTDAA